MNFFKKLFNKQTSIKTTLTITSSNGFHLRPIAKFVNEVKKFEATVSIEAKGKKVIATQVPKILSLSLEKNEMFTLVCTGEKAQHASTSLSSFFVELMNEDKVESSIVQVTEHYEATSIQGQSVGKGIAIATLAPLQRIEKVEESATSMREALELSKKELSKLYEENSTNANAEIFLAQKELLSAELFTTNISTTTQLKEVISQEINSLKGTKFETRIDDYLDLEKRVLLHMGVKSELSLPSLPYILITKTLLPSDISTLKETPIRGVVLQEGNNTSHVAILLRSAGIPSIIIQDTLSPSKIVILDANSGQLILNPTKADFQKAERLKQEFFEQEDKNFSTRKNISQTLSGKSINVLANITNLQTAKEAKEQGADGIGLFRTEFLFTEHQPSVEEQKEAYTEVFEIFDEITIRTLDIGGDKSLPYISMEKEDNPFLGIRGIRFSLQEQTLFKEQLLAIFKAVGSVTPNKKTIKIMFPMVSTTQEFTEAKNIAKSIAQENNLNISNIQFGIMLEVPSVIFALKTFDKLVDFYSIGSNDLTQYLFAIERTHPTLTVDSTSPMLMEALRQIINNTNKPLSICGEVAGLEVATKELINMGYNTLSISSKLIPSIKENIRNI